MARSPERAELVAHSTSADVARSAPPARTAARRQAAPTREIEQLLWGRGHEIVVGIDEVGRGAWAGPLMVGAAILPRQRRVNGVRDSKVLSERRREALFDRIADWCDAWAVGAVTQEECDQLGMSAAQKLAARRAIEGLGVVPDVAVTDGKWDFVSPAVGAVELVVKADRRCLSVAAASILAKVVRDRQMRAEAEHYPHWSFATNKGYPCPLHKFAIQGYGPSAIHRRSWVFMDNYNPWTGVRRTPPAGQTSLF
ncbi:MAG: ribonuclease HII [Ilumatobacter sp.]|uniref:ribonuclease HII n=1 Tax=Ilumatobacter sp. TaxID=1967498 RepID=UPI00391BE713